MKLHNKKNRLRVLGGLINHENITWKNMYDTVSVQCKEIPKFPQNRDKDDNSRCTCQPNLQYNDAAITEQERNSHKIVNIGQQSSDQA